MDDTGPQNAKPKGWYVIFLYKKIMGDFVPGQLYKEGFLEYNIKDQKYNHFW